MIKFNDSPNFTLSKYCLFYSHIFYIIHEDSFLQNVLQRFWIAFTFRPLVSILEHFSTDVKFVSIIPFFKTGKKDKVNNGGAKDTNT